jgi:hypothetical protein
MIPVSHIKSREESHVSTLQMIVEAHWPVSKVHCRAERVYLNGTVQIQNPAHCWVEGHRR